jgi:PAS domain-containing protein
VQKKSFDSFMDYAPMPIAILDSGLRFVKVNRAMAEAHRTSASAHLGKTVNEVLPNLSRRIQQVLLSVLATGEPAIATMKGGVLPIFQSPSKLVSRLLSMRRVADCDHGPGGNRSGNRGGAQTQQ